MAGAKTLAQLTGGATTRRASSSPPTVPLPLEKLETPGAMQSRGAIDADVIEAYAERMAYDAITKLVHDPEGKPWPPVEVYLIEPERHVVVDGFHRVAAARRAELTHIRCILHEGSEQDALIHSLGVNARHGLPRSRADKRRAVVRALEEPELRCLTDKAIASICAVSNRFVGSVREELEVDGTIPIEATLWHDKARSTFYERPEDTLEARKQAREAAAHKKTSLKPARVTRKKSSTHTSSETPGASGFGEAPPASLVHAAHFVAYPVSAEDWRQLTAWLRALPEEARARQLIVPIPSGSSVLERLGEHIGALGELGYGLPHTLGVASHRATYFVFGQGDRAPTNGWIQEPSELHLDGQKTAFAGIILHDWPGQN